RRRADVVLDNSMVAPELLKELHEFPVRKEFAVLQRQGGIQRTGDLVEIVALKPLDFASERHRDIRVLLLEEAIDNALVECVDRGLEAGLARKQDRPHRQV